MHLALGFLRDWFCLLLQFSVLSKFATWGEKYDNIYASPRAQGASGKNQYSPQVLSSELLRGDRSTRHQALEEKYNRIWSGTEHASNWRDGIWRLESVCPNTPGSPGAVYAVRRDVIQGFLSRPKQLSLTSVSQHNGWPWIENSSSVKKKSLPHTWGY